MRILILILGFKGLTCRITTLLRVSLFKAVLKEIEGSPDAHELTV